MSLLPDRASRGTASVVGWILLIGAVAGTVVLGTLPAPYVIEKPGPVYDTIGEIELEGEAVPVIEIDGEQTYPTSGTLDMLTVTLQGNPQSPLSWIDIALAWFDPTRAVLPLEAVYPDGQTSDEANQEAAVDMVDSQQEAAAAALSELGIAYTSIVTVSGVLEGAPADGVLEAGDRILTVDGEQIDGVTQLRTVLAAAGVGTTVTLGITRGDENLEVELAPAAADDGSPIIGIETGAEFDFPFDVTVNLGDVGGPSAGMMLALGTYDKLTPGALTDGERIAGTGTITADGEVGAIGGIRQKMYGAQDAGADWFLAPASNCDEVVGHIPAGLEVFSVSTLDEALQTVETIADEGDTSTLARCGS